MVPLPEGPEAPAGADGEGPNGEFVAVAVASGVVELVMADSMQPTTDRYQSVFILVSAPPGTSAAGRPHWYP